MATFQNGYDAKQAHKQAMPWSAEEDRLLSLLYPVLPTKSVAKQLGRSPTAVKKRANNKGIRKQISRDGDNHYRRWTDAEDSVLRQWVGVITAKAIGEMLGRTETSVRFRIQKLGLDGRVSGTAHWARRHSYIVEQAVRALRRANFTPLQIAEIVRNKNEVSKTTINRWIYEEDDVVKS